MIAVIFEMIPQQGQMESYQKQAAELAQKLTTQAGFISVERFQSLSDPEKLLSLSFWQDEESVSAWRNQPDHRQAQQKGKEQLFRHYRVRVALVCREYDLTSSNPAPKADLSR